jgi:uncharacterized protein YneF (UPF0154 family)
MNFVNAFQKIGLTIAAILAVVFFGGGFFISSISSAKADNPTVTNSAGKIMMSESGFLLNGKPAYHILVWDTETGKSKLHTYDFPSGKIVNATYQLPSSPLY